MRMALYGVRRMPLPCTRQVLSCHVWRADAELYKEVKRASDSFLGVPSQCFVTRKASIGVPAPRGRPQYCSNIAMKVRCDCRVQR